MPRAKPKRPKSKPARKGALVSGNGSAPVEYVEAIGRNPGEENQHSHLYVKVSAPTDVAAMVGLGARTGYLPMCFYGWNRSDGQGFSILRCYSGGRGLCKICEKRRAAGLPGVEAVPGSHKTKWL